MPEFDTHLIAFYLPQFHPIPENDGWWGTGRAQEIQPTYAILAIRAERGSKVPQDLDRAR